MKKIILISVVVGVSIFFVVFVGKNSNSLLRLNPTFWMNQHVYFPTQEKPDNDQLLSQILIGSSSNLLRNEAPEIFPTENGVYTLGWMNFHDYTKQGFNEEKRITRTDLEGNILWSFKLENEFHNWEYRTVFVEFVLSDLNENLYIYGLTKHVQSLYGYKIPKDNNTFVMKMLPNGSIQWIQFFSKEWERKEMLFHANKIYLSGTNENKDFVIMTLNPETGDMVMSKTELTQIKNEGNSNLSQYCSDSGIHLIYNSLLVPGTGGVKINVYTFSYSGKFLWHKEIVHNFLNELTDHTRIEEIHITSNSSNLFISGTLFSDEKNDTIKPVTSFIYALSQDGSLCWKYIPEFTLKKAILSLKCNEESVYLLGDNSIPNSSLLKYNEDRVLYLQALTSTDGKQKWIQNFQNTIKAPYYQFMSDWNKHFGVYHGTKMQLKENGIAFVTTTKNKNLIVKNGQLGYFEEITPENVEDPTEQPCYSIMAELDLQGNITFSTYTTTDASKEQILKTPQSTVDTYQEFFIAEWIYDMKVFQDKIFTIGSTNNSQTALYNSGLNSVSLENYFKTSKHLFRNGKFIGMKYFFILSVYNCFGKG
ncbi:MAG: hypothetical protein KAH01_04515 [Caldisericia bacterium]|nr:hypothetical protein [Caldisericia bacterium]